MAQADFFTNGPKMALIALGSNVASRYGGPEATVRAAIAALREEAQGAFRASALYRTPFVPAGAQPDVVNAVVAMERSTAPAETLAWLHEIEAGFGRVRAARWGNRVIDLDLLGQGAAILPDRDTFARWAGLNAQQAAREAPGELVLPHPRMQERAFVLVPAADVAPDWRHPVSGQSVAEMLAALPEADVAEVRRIG